MARSNARSIPQTTSRRPVVFGATLAAAGLVAGMLLWSGDENKDNDTYALVPSSPDPARDVSPQWQQPTTADVPAPLTQVAASGKASEPAEEMTAAELQTIADMFSLDPYGQLVVDSKLLAALEVLGTDFSATAGLEHLQRAQEALRRALPGDAGQRAADLMAAYQDYRREVAQLSPQSMSMQNDGMAPDLLLERMHALRRQHFDAATADALFGAEEAQARYSLETMRIEQDVSLSPEQRQERIYALRRQLPPEVLAPFENSATAQVDDLAAEVAAMRERGASEADVQYLREQRLGVDAARELANMETQQAEWDQRYRLYRQERALIDAAGLSEQDKQAQIGQLRSKHFAEQELAAVRAYDQGVGR